MKTKALVALGFLAIISWSSYARAWNGVGHEVIASLAWDGMSAEDRKTATAILKDHPFYKEDFESAVPAGATVEEHDRLVFMKAATWPDMIKSRVAHPKEARDDHRNWHYIDYPIDLGGAEALPPEPSATMPATAPTMATDTMPATAPATTASTTLAALPVGPKNLLQALEKCRKDLADTSDDLKVRQNRAKALCWILHLIGDMHQPLHSVSGYSLAFPEGDSGGNGIKVPGTSGATNLHALWDDMLGKNEDPAALKIIADKIKEDPANTPTEAEAKATALKEWVLESKAIAEAFVYGPLKKLPDAKNATHMDVDEDYLVAARKIARHRAEVAGRRLAEFLHKSFNP